MKAFFTLLVFLSLFVELSSQTVSVDPVQLSDALKQEVTDKIAGEISDAVNKGEQQFLKDNYINIMLEPLEPFGIDPNDPQFINNAKSLYDEIKAELQKDPSLSASDLLKGKIKGFVKSGLMNYAGSYIDDDSKEIYSQVSNLVSSGKKQIQNLLEATESISDLDAGASDYTAQIASTLKSYGIKSDYFYLMDDLETLIGEGIEKYADPIQAVYMIAQAANSNNPSDKISLLFEFGETFGGKVPVIGALITPLFTVAKGVLDAANRLEGVIENNLGQGCIYSDGGYSITRSDKKSKFLNKYKNIVGVCPIKQKPYSPVYSNIYYDEGNTEQLFFYIKNNWFRGKKDNLHAGAQDIKATIRWLRSNGHFDKVNDLGFVFASYQKEYGWTAYSKAVDEKLTLLDQVYSRAYNTINICSEAEVKNYFMNKTGFGWFEMLLHPVMKDIEWDDLRHFNNMIPFIKNRMIYNYYMAKNKPNLNHFDRIINNIKATTPVHIYGTVKYENGTPINGAEILVGKNLLFDITSSSEKYVTDGYGYFSYYIYLNDKGSVDPTIVTVSATNKENPDRYIKSAEIRIEIDKTREYRVELTAPLPEDNNAVTADNGSGSGNDNNNPSVDPNTADITTLISQAPCADDPNAIAEWDDAQQKVICSCIENYVWDEAKQKCVQDIDAILANSDCSDYPNTEPKWDYDNNEAYCDCKPGYVWDETDYTKGCISEKQQLLAQTDCSQYGHAMAVWDEANQTATCDCEPGYVWNEAGTECISENQALLAQIDCSQFPNTEPKWDEATHQGYCDCKPGYKWNSDYTECVKEVSQNPGDYYCKTPNTQPVWDDLLKKMVCDCKPGYMWNQSHTNCIPIKRRPSINWDNVLNMTMSMLNAMNNGQNPPLPGGNTPGGQPGGGNTQQPTVSRNNCNDKVEEGGDAPEVHIIDLGRSYGRFAINYSMHDIKDQIIVSQGGRVIYDSGCVSGNNTVQLDLNGFSREIQVRINPNCEGTTGTKWEFTVHCPQ